MKFKPIVNPTPADLILEQILNLLKSGELSPGERLPSEYELQKAFSVTKQQLKTAFKRLELYGVIETKPQSGTFISNIYSKILEGLVRNIIALDDATDFMELYEARLILEVRAAELAAERADEKELRALRDIHQDFVKAVATGERGGDLDIYFHMEIIRLSKNKTMISMFSLITKKLVDFWVETDGVESYVSQERAEQTIAEHGRILEALSGHDAKASGLLMREHLERSMKVNE